MKDLKSKSVAALVAFAFAFALGHCPAAALAAPGGETAGAGLSAQAVSTNLSEYGTVSVGDDTYWESSSVYEPTIRVDTTSTDFKQTKVLTRGTDYTISYQYEKDYSSSPVTVSGFSKPGYYIVTATGKGSYSGSCTHYVTVYANNNIQGADIQMAHACFASTTAYQPAFKLTARGNTLKEGTDYQVSWVYNGDLEAGDDFETPVAGVTKAGYYTPVITGKGSWAGSSRDTTVVAYDATVAAIPDQYYTGKQVKPSVKVTCGDLPMFEGHDYTLSYKNNVSVGTATVTVTGVNFYAGTISKTFKIKGKKANTLSASAKAKTHTVKYSKLKKGNQTIAKSKAFKVSGAQGKVTFKKKTGNAKITVSSAGKVTVKKGLKKGSYAVKVDVMAAGTNAYSAASRTVSFTVKVK